MTNTCLIPNGKIIIFNFPAGAGGKMLQNCVGLSRHCVLMKLEYAQWQIAYSGNINNEFYQQKLNWILQTLPTKDKMYQWYNYEHGEKTLYGIDYSGFKAHVPIPNAEIYQLAEHNLWSTVTVHNFVATEHYRYYWPTVSYVTLVNSQAWVDRCATIKCPGLIKDLDWSTNGITPKGLGFEFDIDTSMLDTDKFLNQIKLLYEYLNFDDFPQDYINEYHTRYIELHV